MIDSVDDPSVKIPATPRRLVNLADLDPRLGEPPRIAGPTIARSTPAATALSCLVSQKVLPHKSQISVGIELGVG